MHFWRVSKLNRVSGFDQLQVQPLLPVDCVQTTNLNACYVFFVCLFNFRLNFVQKNYPKFCLNRMLSALNISLVSKNEFCHSNYLLIIKPCFKVGKHTFDSRVKVVSR